MTCPRCGLGFAKENVQVMEIVAVPRAYFISDLHIALDEGEWRFEPEEELIALLGEISDQPGAALILLGDIFDFWQMDGAPAEKMRRIINAHPRLFSQLHRLAQTHRVLYLPGNHDREALYDPDMRSLLSEHGLQTIDKTQLLAEIGAPGDERVLRVLAEHGHESDPYNQYLHGPHPAERPFAEQVMRLFINPVKRMDIGRDESWLRDIDCVNPLPALPWWLASKYFYIEAAFWIRALAVPLALLFGVTKLGLLLVALPFMGVELTSWGIPRLPVALVYVLLGSLLIDATVIAVALLVWALRRDALKTLHRWGVDDLDAILRRRTILAEERARSELTAADSDLYLCGHSHAAFLQELSPGRLWGNCGTWVKRLFRVPARLHLLPVFVPNYRLTYFVAHAVAGEGRIELRMRRKTCRPNLTFLERFAMLGRKPRLPKEPDFLLDERRLPTRHAPSAPKEQGVRRMVQ